VVAEGARQAGASEGQLGWQTVRRGSKRWRRRGRTQGRRAWPPVSRGSARPQLLRQYERTGQHTHGQHTHASVRVHTPLARARHEGGTRAARAVQRSVGGLDELVRLRARWGVRAREASVPSLTTTTVASISVVPTEASTSEGATLSAVATADALTVGTAMGAAELVSTGRVAVKVALRPRRRRRDDDCAMVHCVGPQTSSRMAEASCDTEMPSGTVEEIVAASVRATSTVVDESTRLAPPTAAVAMAEVSVACSEGGWAVSKEPRVRGGRPVRARVGSGRCDVWPGVKPVSGTGV
jgi:hypothetical protein